MPWSSHSLSGASHHCWGSGCHRSLGSTFRPGRWGSGVLPHPRECSDPQRSLHPPWRGGHNACEPQTAGWPVDVEPGALPTAQHLWLPGQSRKGSPESRQRNEGAAQTVVPSGRLTEARWGSGSLNYAHLPHRWPCRPCRRPGTAPGDCASRLLGNLGSPALESISVFFLGLELMHSPKKTRKYFNIGHEGSSSYNSHASHTHHFKQVCMSLPWSQRSQRWGSDPRDWLDQTATLRDGFH